MIVNRVAFNNFRNYSNVKVAHAPKKEEIKREVSAESDILSFMGLKANLDLRIQNRRIKSMEKHLGAALELDNLADAVKVLDYFDINYTVMGDGFVKIRGDYPYSYKQRSQEPEKKGPKDYGIDENKLFKFIKKIEGSVFLDDTNVTNTGALESVGLNVWLQGSKVSEMPNLKYVGRDLYAPYTTGLKTLGDIEYVGGTLNVTKSEVEDFGKIKYVGQNVLARDSKVKDLGQIETIGGSVDMSDFDSEDISKLRHVGRNINFANSKVKDADTLVYVGGNAIFEDSEVESARNLSFVKGDLKLGRSKIKEFPSLTYVGHDLDAEDSNLWLAMALSYVGNSVNLKNAPPVDLRSLRYIGGVLVGLKDPNAKRYYFDRTFIGFDHRSEAMSLGKLEFNKMEAF